MLGTGRSSKPVRIFFSTNSSLITKQALCLERTLAKDFPQAIGRSEDLRLRALLLSGSGFSGVWGVRGEGGDGKGARRDQAEKHLSCPLCRKCRALGFSRCPTCLCIFAECQRGCFACWCDFAYSMHLFCLLRTGASSLPMCGCLAYWCILDYCVLLCW